MHILLFFLKILCCAVSIITLNIVSVIRLMMNFLQWGSSLIKSKPWQWSFYEFWFSYASQHCLEPFGGTLMVRNTLSMSPQRVTLSLMRETCAMWPGYSHLRLKTHGSILDSWNVLSVYWANSVYYFSFHYSVLSVCLEQSKIACVYRKVHVTWTSRIWGSVNSG